MIRVLDPTNEMKTAGAQAAPRLASLKWALAEVSPGGAALDDVMAQAARAGHDLSKSRDFMTRMLAN